MEEMLTVYVPEEIGRMLNRTPEELGRDLRLYAALMLFKLGKLSSGAAAELAGVPRVLFFDLCTECGIPLSQITPADLHREIQQVKKRQNKFWVWLKQLDGGPRTINRGRPTADSGR
jgi:predicted HTH domain antitoxin